VPKFNEFIKKVNGYPNQLPLAHTCDGYSFDGILQDNKILAKQCNNFNGEKLIYMFYGRPAYRTHKTLKATKNPAFFPVCLIFSGDSIKKIKRIVPFDSGAFCINLLKEYVYPDMSIDKFVLDPSIDMAQKVVGNFFETNKNYYDCKPRKVLLPNLEFEAVCYQNIITAEENAEFDDRVSTIEVQVGKNLNLSSSLIEFIILPVTFLEEEKVRNAIKKWNAKFDTYFTHRGSIAEYMGIFMEKTRTYLHNRMYL